MDIEDLSKSQLLLLTILVNFVVSIATGILTVSLLDQAPQTVTQTVDRIVDHTIETVATQVPVIGKPSGSAPSSEELLTAAVAADASRTVSISYKAGAQTPSVTGIYLPKEKIVIGASAELPEHVTVSFGNGTLLEADRTAVDGALMRFTFAPGAMLPSATSASYAAVADLKQGQTVIGLTAEGKAVTGIIAKIGATSLDADLPALPAGAAIVNLSGAIAGIAQADGSFIPADRVKALAAAP